MNGISYSNNTNYTASIPQIIMHTKKLQELPVTLRARTWKRLAGSRMDCLTLWPHHNISLSWCFIQSYESYVTWHHLYVFCLTNLWATLYKFMYVNHVQIYRFICSCIAHLNDGLPQSSQFPLCSPSLWTSAFLSSSSPYGTGEPCVINHKLQ